MELLWSLRKVQCQVIGDRSSTPPKTNLKQAAVKLLQFPEVLLVNVPRFL